MHSVYFIPTSMYVRCYETRSTQPNVSTKRDGAICTKAMHRNNTETLYITLHDPFFLCGLYFSRKASCLAFMAPRLRLQQRREGGGDGEGERHRECVMGQLHGIKLYIATILMHCAIWLLDYAM